MDRLTVTREEFRDQFLENIKNLFRKTVEQASENEILYTLCYTVRDIIVDQWIATHEIYEKNDSRTVYYLSMEYLIGPMLRNNLYNLQVRDLVKGAIEDLELDLEYLENLEKDPGLGNGGLGRLAACFMDSLATMELPAYGCGIRYRYGIFEQEIVEGYQIEKPDNWLGDLGNPFEVKRLEYAVEVRFGGDIHMNYLPNGKIKFYHENYEAVKAVPYDIPMVGYNNNTVNTLRLWDAQPMEEFDLTSFDRGDYEKAVEDLQNAKNIVEVLYPNDNHYQGKVLRLKQQYFFVSATVQTVIQKFKKNHTDLRQLPEKVVFQLNDTHPTVAIGEIMRILLDQELMEWEEAWKITQKVCAFTNHTILSEALEKWPIQLFSKLLPRVYQIIEEINRRFLIDLGCKFCNGYDKANAMSIIADGEIKMAWLAIVGSFSVNGVAELHTDILKKQELKNFYEIFPEKFNNKTNGVTQRRFLLSANPLLADWITSKIGNTWITDFNEIKRIETFAGDEKSIKAYMEIKHKNKIRLAKYIQDKNHIEVDPQSIFDVQIKRLHEYKRQLLNVLHIMHLYNQIKDHPEKSISPRTFIFGAKAAPGYRRAKLIIKLINNVAEVINNDPQIENKIKVIFIENYRVSNAEIIVPAGDVSEQISTASKEASGTGNMKLMINGALTIGTLDGANIEIKEEVGDENIFIFGLSSDEVLRYYKNGGYNPQDIYNRDEDLKKVMDQLVDGTLAPDDPDLFREIYDSLLYDNRRADEYFVLKDFRSYVEAQDKVGKCYGDLISWGKKAIINTANSGKFSSDRTIEDYNREIWKLKQTSIKL